MLYEKKMLILSGSGRGVVLMEKSARGAVFTLRTFDMPKSVMPLKAGVVTKTKVYVRDLPTRDDPAATFTLELDSLCDLHFAVFDDELKLYGCTGKRMWESNLMDLLTRHERRAPVLNKPALSPLPPIAEPPRVLPLPDGTGIPQTRLAVYGDDALAENDFYTQIDMSERMLTVDGFLDTPRVLEGLAPTVEPSHRSATEPIKESASTSIAPEYKEAAVTVTADVAADASSAETEDVPDESAIENATESEFKVFDVIEDETVAPSDTTTATADDAFGELGEIDESPIEIPDTVTAADKKPDSAVVAQTLVTVSKSKAESAERLNEAQPQTDEFEPIAEVAAGADVIQPWERTASWIKKRSGRELVVKKPRIKPISVSDKLKHLRATEFFERARRDIDILFASAARDETLNGLIDDVEWVKVDVDGNVVSVGRSGNAFLCYAVAGTYERVPPLGEEAQWLPRDKAVPTGRGYWVIFQNLATGEIIK